MINLSGMRDEGVEGEGIRSSAKKETSRKMR